MGWIGRMRRVGGSGGIGIELDLDLGVEPSDRKVLVRAKIELLESVTDTIYQATIEYISAALSFHPTTEAIFGFRRSTAEADFLFGPDIRRYLDELFKHGLALQRWAEEYRDRTQPLPPGYDHQKVVEGKHKESLWFAGQHDEALRRFKGYLNLTDHRSRRLW